MRADRHASSPTMDELKSKLRDAGLRATGSRLAALRVLLAAHTPLSHNDLVESLASEPWDRATLYRNLLDLVRVGLARRADMGDHIWRFEASKRSHPTGDHPHFVCTECGTVECLPAKMLSFRDVAAAPAALRRKDIEVQVRGLCDKCHEPHDK